MAKTLQLEIITPEKLLFEQEVEFFSVRATDGDLGVLPNHAPLFASLAPSVLKFKQQGKDDFVAIMGGFLEVSNNRATVLADVAELAADIDILRAKKAKERAEVELTEKRELANTAEITAAMRRALLRLHVADLIKHRRGRTGNLPVR